MAQVGIHLKQLRMRRKLSVRELAQRSGISHATISLVERDKTSPSVDTLSAMLDALGTTLVGFFDGLQTTLPYSPFYDEEDLVEIGDQDTISYRMLGMNHPNRHILMLKESYAVGADTGEAFSHRSQEAGFILSGQVEVTVGDQTRVLGPGQGYYFDSQMPHRFRNVGPGTAEIISAVTPPTY
ncbi:cupin domain-containing protein [Xylophilus rhododendri]|uniref:Cupin domain-containing protein n=1 Tax=Xylophilus rhododendri TaxID=2697032 RepID=A0A857J3L5_9BURK|nr:cupin domain-containing protein [Xylophilus rhododendri]QHI97729.1 cupin domain-containing protein [Xylophilus rhododendri]